MKFILLILLLSLSAHAQRFNTSIADSEYEGLFGAVHSVRYETAAITFNDKKMKETSRWLDSTVTYDWRGNMVDVSYYGDGKVQRKYVYTYDRSNNLALEREYDYGKTLLYFVNYLYITRQNTVVRLMYKASGELMPNRIISVYDNRGKVIKLIQDDGAQNPLIWILLKYNDDGKPVEFIHCSINNRNVKVNNQSGSCGGAEYTGKVITTYNEKGNINRETQYNEDGSVSSDVRYEYEYDARGSWVKQFRYDMQAVNGEVGQNPSQVRHRFIQYRRRNLTTASTRPERRSLSSIQMRRAGYARRYASSRCVGSKLLERSNKMIQKDHGSF